MALAELDEIARGVLAEAGATSPFLGYQPGFAPIPFPAVICTSVNDAALHGIPGSYRLAEGDLYVLCGLAVLAGMALALAWERAQTTSRPPPSDQSAAPRIAASSASKSSPHGPQARR